MHKRRVNGRDCVRERKEELATVHKGKVNSICGKVLHRKEGKKLTIKRKGDKINRKTVRKTKGRKSVR